MLTVLHKTKDAEVFYEALEISNTYSDSEYMQGLHITRPNSLGPVTLCLGIAYVMNDAGATVGKFNLQEYVKSQIDS